MRSVRPSEKQTQIKVINDEIIVTILGAVLILNGDLKTIKRYDVDLKTIKRFDVDAYRKAQSFDGNEEYIAVGYDDGKVHFYTRKSNEEPTVSTKKDSKKQRQGLEK